LLQPQLILSVGRISAHNLLGTEDPVGRLRGRVHRFDPGDIPLIVTYHPAYLLRRPQEKSKAWQDLQAAYRQLNQA
jgi:DNA polymerase